MIFVFNHSKDPAVLVLSLRLPWMPHRARDLIKDRRISFDSREQLLIFHKSLPAGGIWVFELEREKPLSFLLNRSHKVKLAG
jgi:hypothetical protein